MRVLLLWWHYNPDKTGFALAVRGEAIAKYLKRMGDELLVFSPDYDHASLSYDFEGVKVERVPTFESIRAKYDVPESVLFFPLALCRLVQKARGFSPDVIVVSQPSYTLPIQGILMARILGIPCMLDLQDLFVQEVELTALNFRNRMKLLFERIVLKNVDFIFVVLPYMRDVAVRKYGIPKRKFKILYNGVDSEKFPKMDVLEKDKDIDLIHMGGPKAYYDTRRLIDAFSLIVKTRPKTNLIFTDYSDQGYQREIKEYADRKRLSGNIRFLGQVPRNELLNMLSRARIGVYTLYDAESSKVVVGTKIFEYMVMGLPIAHMGWKGGNMNRLIEENDIGIIGEGIQDFAEKVLELLEDGERRRIYGENGRRNIGKYDWRYTVLTVFQSQLERLVLKSRGPIDF